LTFSSKNTFVCPTHPPQSENLVCLTIPRGKVFFVGKATDLRCGTRFSAQTRFTVPALTRFPVPAQTRFQLPAQQHFPFLAAKKSVFLGGLVFLGVIAFLSFNLTFQGVLSKFKFKQIECKS